jgi:hypothetical protein
MLVLSSASDTSATFSVGAWEGQCIRFEESRCVEYEAVNAGEGTLRLTRTASTLRVRAEPDDCSDVPRPASVNPTYSATTMTHMIRGRVFMAMTNCRSNHAVPELLSEDIAEILRQTEGVAEQ